MKSAAKEPRIPVVVGDRVIVDGCHTKYRPTVRRIYADGNCLCSVFSREVGHLWARSRLQTVAQWKRGGKRKPKTPKRIEKEW